MIIIILFLLKIIYFERLLMFWSEVKRMNREQSLINQKKTVTFGIILLSIGFIISGVIASFQPENVSFLYGSLSFVSFLFWMGVIFSYGVLFLGFYSMIVQKKWLFYVFTGFLIWSFVCFAVIMVMVPLNVFGWIGIIFVTSLLFITIHQRNTWLYNTDIDNEIKKSVEKESESKKADSSGFIYDGYQLFKRRVNKRGGGTRMMYFFSKRDISNADSCDKPANYEVNVNKNGVPYLKKVKK
jgi:hypothetical protein